MSSQVQVLESIRDVLSGKDLGKNTANQPAEPPAALEPEDEILDLTQMLNDDGSVTDLANLNEGQTMAQNQDNTDVLNEIDKLLGDSTPAATDLDIDAIMAASAPAASPEPETQLSSDETTISDDASELVLANIPATIDKTPEEHISTLISDESANKAKSAIADMLAKTGKKEPAFEASPAPSFRNGDTVEDLVMEGLRPMLKAWLDTNLPSLVEEIVQREISKIIPK